MIYTIGGPAYPEFLKEKTKSGEIPWKVGKTDLYPGGSVWKTREEAQECADKGEGYSVYGVLADWDTETVESDDFGATWHNLLVDAKLVHLLDKE